VAAEDGLAMPEIGPGENFAFEPEAGGACGVAVAS